jgi:iron complex outermembrane recepter protein
MGNAGDLAVLTGFLLVPAFLPALAEEPLAAGGRAEIPQLQTVSVTGSALPRTDTETPSPVIVISADDIRRRGFVSVAEAVRSLAADNSGTIPTAFTGGAAAGAAGVALRGLTVNSTLVLIDGRRVASYAVADDGQRSFVDLNTIPLAAVDRIEVLMDGASSLYGADAIGGVVNILLRRDFHGFEGSAGIGNSQHGGGWEKRASALAGSGDLERDRYDAWLSVEFETRQRIAATSRAFPFDTADLSSIGGFNLGGGQPAFNSGSIYGAVMPATLGTPGDLLTGTPVPGALWQPLRDCGPGSMRVNDPDDSLGGGAGSYCAQNLLAQYSDDQPAQERFGSYGRLNVRIDDGTLAYFTAGYFQNRVIADQIPSQIQATIPNDTNSIALPPMLPDGSPNPNDPFAASGQYALISYAFGDITRDSQYANHALRASAGITGTIGDWSYDSAIVFDRTWLRSQFRGFIAYRALIDAITDGSYDFVDPSRNSSATRAALSPTLAKTSTTVMDSVDLRATRALADLPGGAAGLAVGAEIRHEAQNDPELDPFGSYQGYGLLNGHGSHNVAAVYGELDAPVSRSLEVDVSARYDRYGDYGGAFDPKIGVKWTPIEQAALRGTLSRGFRAPSFSEGSSSALEGFVNYQIADPDFLAAHHNDAYTAPYLLALQVAANPDIRPERSRSATLGGILQPTSSLSASLDYYAIRKTSVIVAFDPTAALASYFAGSPLPTGYTIVVDGPDPQYPNALPRPVLVRTLYVNANSLRTDGLDLNLKANVDLAGNLRLASDLNATKIFSWTMHFPDGSVQQYAGTHGPYIVSSATGTPRYRANWANTLTRGPWDVTATIYYVSGMFLSAPDIQPGCSSSGPTGENFPPNCRAPSFTYVDLTGLYRFRDHVSFSFGVQNLLDRKPSLDPIAFGGINYSVAYAQAGIVGRFFRLGIDVRF